MRAKTDRGHTDLDGVLAGLRSQGHRITPARRAVIHALLTAGHDLSASEVAAAVERTQPDTHLSTVYRTLEALEDAGVIVHVHAHGGVAYQLADRRQLHAMCDTCGAVVELPPALLSALTTRLRRDHDFELDATHSPLVGRCASCRRQTGTTPHRHGRT